MLKVWNNPVIQARKLRAIKRAMKRPEIIAKKSGPNHWNWNGGIERHEKGYRYKLAKSHPRRTKHGYVREHRLVVERLIGRFLLPTEVVHHLGTVTDNRPHKLMAFTSDSVHKRFHRGIEPAPHELVWDGRLLSNKPTARQLALPFLIRHIEVAASTH
jgi:hypothetical protein